MTIEPFEPEEAAGTLDRWATAIDRAVVGQRSTIELAIATIVGRGHALVLGDPGTGKTRLVRALALSTGLDTRRIQFTPDLLPGDITGSETLVFGSNDAHERVEFRRGPVFTELLLADEINRGTPRTQSALLEAMEERAVTIGNARHELPARFTVFATRNPIEMAGTYPLPEAQLDRFLVEIDVSAPSVDAMVDIVLSVPDPRRIDVEAVVSPEDLDRLEKSVEAVVVTETVAREAAEWIDRLRPTDGSPTAIRDLVAHGPGVRALRSLIALGRVHALKNGRAHASIEDLRTAVRPALRHRLVWTFEGRAHTDPFAAVLGAAGVAFE